MTNEQIAQRLQVAMEQYKRAETAEERMRARWELEEAERIALEHRNIYRLCSSK